MRVISRRALRQVWERHQDSERLLKAWEKAAKRVRWANWADLKQTFGSADRVGSCVVFDVGNNKFRLIGRVFYGSQRVYVLKVMTHAEYDRKDPRNKGRSRWETDCRCHERQPEERVEP